MLSMIQSTAFILPSFPTHKTTPNPSKTTLPLKPKANFTLFSPRNKKFQVSAAAEALVADTETEFPSEDDNDDAPEAPEKVVVTVKQVQKPRLVLKFIWMEKNIGLGLDQVIPGHGTVPLSPYFFWPRKDAWEELKVVLESKPWISQKKMIILLNQATDIINLWQQSGGNLS